MSTDHPPIVVRRRDEAPLHAAATAGLLGSPRQAGALLEKLARATVTPDDEAPADLVGLKSQVTFFELEAAGPRIRKVQIVEHPARKPLLGQVSVLSPLGAGLIGLAPGHSITWPDRHGGVRRFTVLSASTVA